MKKQMTFSASKVNTGMRNLASQPTEPFDVSRPSRRAFLAGSASFVGLAAASPMAFAAEFSLDDALSPRVLGQSEAPIHVA